MLVKKALASGHAGDVDAALAFAVGIAAGAPPADAAAIDAVANKPIKIKHGGAGGN